jgi:hypothetical protein
LAGAVADLVGGRGAVGAADRGLILHDGDDFELFIAEDAHGEDLAFFGRGAAAAVDFHEGWLVAHGGRSLGFGVWGLELRALAPGGEQEGEGEEDFEDWGGGVGDGRCLGEGDGVQVEVADGVGAGGVGEAEERGGRRRGECVGVVMVAWLPRRVRDKDCPPPARPRAKVRR